MFVSIDDLISEAEKMPPFSLVAKKALSLLLDPDINMNELGNILGTDQTLASLVLRWANSAYYGLSQPVYSVNHAVMCLGQNVVRNLVLTASLWSFMDKDLPGYQLKRGDLWKHSVGIAIGAKFLLEKFGKKISEEGYSAGLICDIGKLVFDKALINLDIDPEKLENKPFPVIERDNFGIDHAYLGYLLTKRWNLPESIITAVMNHHQPSLAGEHIKITSAIHLADSALMSLGIGVGIDGLKYELEPEVFKTLDYPEDKMQDLMLYINEQINELVPYIGIDEET